MANSPKTATETFNWQPNSCSCRELQWMVKMDKLSHSGGLTLLGSLVSEYLFGGRILLSLVIDFQFVPIQN